MNANRSAVTTPQPCVNTRTWRSYNIPMFFSRQEMPRSSLCNMARSVHSRKSGASRIPTTSTHPADSSAFFSVRKILLLTGAIVTAALFVPWIATKKITSTLEWRWLPTPVHEWDNRRQQVKDAFISSWDAYSKYAWGAALLLPQSWTCPNLVFRV
jgi:hypothetical protein